MGIGWWRLWRSFPIEAKASGSVNVAGKSLSDGRVYLHSTDGQIIGAKVEKGQFRIPKAPVGKFRVSIEGDGLASRYSGDNSILTIEVRRGVNPFNFDLR